MKSIKYIALSVASAAVLSACTKAGKPAEDTSTTASTEGAIIAPSDVVVNDSLRVTTPLTPTSGDAAAGAEVFKNRKLGNCLACHSNSDMPDELFHGEVGPTLDGVAGRYPIELMRSIVIDPKKVFGSQTIMPGFYSLDQGVRVSDKFQGKTILEAQQVEDLLAYLSTLK